jgi:hypothetical protein
MLRIDSKIAALPVTMAGQNMKRLVDRRTRPRRMVNELEGQSSEQECCYHKE